MKMFKKERIIPGAAIVDVEIVAFNVTEEEVEYAVAILTDVIRTNVFIERDGMIEEF